MGYTVVKSFERGIDTRRMIDTTEPGALLDAVNCHITRGGELEKRAAFAVIGTFPANSVGMYATVLGQIHTWGSDGDASGPLPPNTTYHSIPYEGSTATLTKILSVEEFNGKLYVIALYSDNTILHWYDDDVVTVHETAPPPDPGGGGGTVTPPAGVLQPGMPSITFWLRTNHELLAASTPTEIGLAAVNLVLSIGWAGWVFTPAIVTDATDEWFGPYDSTDRTMIPWDASHVTTAASLMDQVNSFQATSNIMCSAVGNKVTLWVNEITSAYNGYSLYVFFANTADGAALSNAVYAYGSPTANSPINGELSGGFDPPPPGTRRDVGAPMPLAVGDPVPLIVGTFVLAHNSKLYCVQQSTLNFSGLDTAMRWDPAQLGAGNIDHTKIGEGTPTLVSLADYGGDLAVFGARDIFIWHMDPDPEGNFKKQVLHRTGTVAPHSTCAFGESEVMYLDRSGIRSLRSRSGVDAAFAADIGNNIDALVVAKLKTLTPDQLLDNVWSDIEPRSGRLWMALHDVIYVLSYFPGSHIAAWTQYDASEFPIDMMNSSGDSLYWRSGDSLICYGNLSGDEYDDSEALARFPYIDGGKNATSKNWQSIDLAAFGTWQVKASFDPTQPATLDLIANIIKSTYAQQKIAMNGESPAVSLELRSSYVGPARLGNAALHYTDSTAD